MDIGAMMSPAEEKADSMKALLEVEKYLCQLYMT